MFTTLLVRERRDFPPKFMLRKKRGELLLFDLKLERSLQSVLRALRFKTANNNAIITVEKTEEGQEAPPYINSLFCITSANTRMQSMKAVQWNQEASIHNLENQIGQLAKMISKRLLGALPSSTEKNLREHVKAVNLRSGKKLVETPPTAVDKEKENVQAPEESTSTKEDEV
ncbi:hypothetical protein M9H77_24152 [Catharanthus roseus]|uniref:Uncharacterized protein n=1 Tax=Catharanthus roseus TaxID=4058 RepID=A0ACC0AXH2_CATRO|nr:hypothetical protein M9H77_24152 [Catharanthus roseus]